MWDSVSQQFQAFSTPLEGQVLWMYADILGKVTIGMGNLIDSEAAALELPALGVPYYHKEGKAVTDDHIRTDWHKVKDNPALAGHWPQAEPVTELRITEDGVRVLVATKLAQFERYLIEHVAEFASFDGWPADAQLGLLSMAWAMGPAFADGGRWPNFRAACAGQFPGADANPSQRWLDAAANCRMSNDWLTKRNAVNRGLFRNAAWSAADPPDDPSVLFLPIGVSRPVLSEGDADDGNTTYVADVQSWLKWLGYPCPQTGVFDGETTAAVKAFQGEEGFGADGRVGPLTWAALGFGVPNA
jgi:hypothetical protein